MLVALLVLAIADRRGGLLLAGSDPHRYEGRTFRVVAVVDGDTLDLDVPDGDRPTTRVRLWGIDTPEMGRPHAVPARPAEPWAREATDTARGLALGREVTITLEPRRIRDFYGRLLAFVTLPDGEVLNETLLAEGLARADDRWPHRHLDRYARLEAQARHDGRGRWADP